MKLPSLEFLADAFWQTCRRFPAAMLSAAIGTLALMFLIENNDEDFFVRGWMVALLGLPFFTGLTACGEMRGWPAVKNWAAAGIGAALLLGYFFWLDPDAKLFERVELPRYLAWLAVAHLWVSFAPYLNRTSSVADFWEYNKQLFANFVTGGVYTLILWGGLSAAIMAVDQLFDVHIDYKTYGHLFILLAGMFSTAYSLHRFPKDFRFDADEIEFTGAFKNLCKFIFIPIVALYFLILYAYSAKILVTWDLPHGWVSSLVIGFAAAGIFTWLLNFFMPRFDSGSIVGNFKKWFWPVLFPMVGLLFVAIARRIWDYGITEERFFVAHTGAWLTLCCVFFVLIKSEDIKFIPISLAAFVLTAMYGPFSAFESTKRSQTHQLEALLAKNNLLADGKAKPAAQPLTGDDASRIYSCLQVLEDHQALGTVEGWLGKPIADLPAPENTYNDASKICAALNVEFNAGSWQDTHFAVYSEWNGEAEIAGYEQFISVSTHYNTRDDYFPDGRKHFKIDSTDRSTLILFEARTELDRFPMAAQLAAWHALRTGSEYSVTLTPTQTAADLQGKNFTARLFVSNADCERVGDSLQLNSLNGVLFMKKK
ncbi:MAG: DUF4153 domain-containing protein [Saprospiraceae bacterium]